MCAMSHHHVEGDYNQLGGSLPEGLGLLKGLRYLILGYNQFTGMLYILSLLPDPLLMRFLI